MLTAPSIGADSTESAHTLYKGVELCQGCFDRNIYMCFGRHQDQRQKLATEISGGHWDLQNKPPRTPQLPQLGAEQPQRCVQCSRLPSTEPHVSPAGPLPASPFPQGAHFPCFLASNCRLQAGFFEKKAHFVPNVVPHWGAHA